MENVTQVPSTSPTRLTAEREAEIRADDACELTDFPYPIYKYLYLQRRLLLRELAAVRAERDEALRDLALRDVAIEALRNGIAPCTLTDEMVERAAREYTEAWGENFQSRKPFEFREVIRRALTAALGVEG